MVFPVLEGLPRGILVEAGARPAMINLIDWDLAIIVGFVIFVVVFMYFSRGMDVPPYGDE